MKNNFFKFKIVKNKNNSNLNGIFIFLWFKIFFKILRLKDGKRELESYFYLKKYYPVPKLLFYFGIFKKYFLFFKFEEKELFIDYLLFKNDNFIELNKIFEIYFKVFKRTLLYTKTNNHNIFLKMEWQYFMVYYL